MDRIVDRRATLGAALASGSAFLAVLVLVVSGLATGPDIAVLRWAASLHGGPLDVPMIALSGLGVSSALAFFSAFAATLLWATGARRAGVFVLTTWIGGYVLTQALKVIVGRPRPDASFALPIIAPEAQGLIWAALAVVIVSHSGGRGCAGARWPVPPSSSSPSSSTPRSSRPPASTPSRAGTPSGRSS